MAEIQIYRGSEMIIGIDIGGTKTESALFDRNGSILKEHKTGSCHLMNADEKDIIARLKESNLTAEAPIVIGYAGYSRSKEMRDRIDALVRRAFGSRKVFLMSDLDLALLSALEGRDGTMVILGTGSVAVSQKHGEVKRKGGWGYVLGDEGSGYAIGRKALREYVLEADGRKEKDAVYEKINELFQLHDPNELINAVMKDGAPDRTKIAMAARTVTEQAGKCDSCAEIMRNAADEAVSLISSLAGPGETVIGMGGLMHAASYVQMINERASGKFILIPSVHAPVYGAYVYWKEKLSVN